MYTVWWTFPKCGPNADLSNMLTSSTLHGGPLFSPLPHISAKNCYFVPHKQPACAHWYAVVGMLLFKVTALLYSPYLSKQLTTSNCYPFFTVTVPLQLLVATFLSVEVS
jgi:hypothetical protein